ncbi:hypothetical protein [Paenibacillus peoriae]|uniref:hypothetical protein n=1 Tax=Paenibacillus peoriae TaxID=59893 RepID=UPI00215AFE0A|nr:hypothetical protein [Paenibacillus peoriae]
MAAFTAAGHTPGCLLRKGGDVLGLGSKQRQRLAYFLALRFEAGSFAQPAVKLRFAGLTL